MLAYGVGTIPALVVLGLSAGSLAPATRSRLFRLGGLLVLVIGVQLVLRGLHNLGLTGGFAVGRVVFW
jgi:sulfite exporter TauE/SafE